MADTFTENGRKKSEKSTGVLSNTPLLLFDVFFLKLFLTVAFTFSYFAHNFTQLKVELIFSSTAYQQVALCFLYSSTVFLLQLYIFHFDSHEVVCTHLPHMFTACG